MTTRAEIISYEDTKVVVAASTNQQGLLILGDQYYPGWRAYVDGHLVPIIRVNHVLRGVALPPGQHEVLFQFAPRSLRTGIWLSVIGLALLAVLIVLDKHPRVAEWLHRGQGSEMDNG